MAFLLSPKPEGVTYMLITFPYAVSINGSEAQTYSQGAPGTVAPGDVVTWGSGIPNRYAYAASADADPIKTGAATSPYTVEAVAGATLLALYGTGLS